MDDTSLIEKKKQSKDKNSERLFENLYSTYISKREFEFAIKTNELVECDKKNLPDNCGFPDFLLTLDNQRIVAEVTTAHDLDDPNAIDAFHPGITKVISGGIAGKISARVYTKISKGNFKNVDKFHLPIIFVIFNNQHSSCIDEVEIDCFLNDYRKYPQNIKDQLMLNENYWVIEKIPRYTLISGILFIESNRAGLRIKYYPSENNKLTEDMIKKLETPPKSNQSRV